jgi:hypothetical protein
MGRLPTVGARLHVGVDDEADGFLPRRDASMTSAVCAALGRLAIERIVEFLAAVKVVPVVGRELGFGIHLVLFHA